VPLLVSGVLGNVVEIFAADDNSTVHLRGDNGASQNATANRNETGEWAFLINIASLDGSLRSAKAQTDILVPSSTALSDSFALGLRFGVKENMRLFLESAF